MRIRFAGLVAILTGCSASNEFAPPPPPTVTVAAPMEREVTVYDEFTGRLDAFETVEIRARVKGFLESVEFEPGRRVEKGATLFTIDEAPFQAAVALAEARLESRAADLKLAEVTLERATRAFEKQAVTEIELAEKEANRDVAAAAVSGAMAELENARIDLGYTKMVAPITGNVSRELVTVGNLVGAGDSTLLTNVVDDDPIYAYFNINERFLVEILREHPRSERGQGAARTCLLILADGSAYAAPGSVDFGDNRVDPTTGTLQVRATFPNPEGQLFPGLFARIRVPRSSSVAMLVPEIAVQRDIVGPFLLVVDGSGTVQRRDVELGSLDDRDRVILGGLDPSERVIVSGLQRARPGLTVNAVEATAAASAQSKNAGDGSGSGPGDGGGTG